MNDIIKLLNLEDPDVIISSVNVQDGRKEITLERKPSPKYCPYCKTRMHSKGIRKRSVNHPMMQDGFSLRLILKQRRWKCINPACSRFVPEDQRGYVKKKAAEDAEPAENTETAEAPESAEKKPAAKKTRAKKTTEEGEEAPKKTTRKTTKKAAAKKEDEE